MLRYHMKYFQKRSDCEVMKERPLVTHFRLAETVYKALLGGRSNLEEERNILDEKIHKEGTKKYRICAHYGRDRILGVPIMMEDKHFLLIRHPMLVVLSNPDSAPKTAQEFGFAQLVALHSEIWHFTKKPPPVIDTSDLKLDTVEDTLRNLCEALDMSFDEKMLRKLGPEGPTRFVTGTHFPERFATTAYRLLDDSLELYHTLSNYVDKKRTPFNAYPDPRNKEILIWVGGEILPRKHAKVSVFDSIVQGDDLVCAGLQLCGGKIFQLDRHIERFCTSAKTLGFKDVPAIEKVKTVILKTLIINGMTGENADAKIWLSLTRGKMLTSGIRESSYFCGHTLIVIAEWKRAGFDEKSSLSTSTMPRDLPHIRETDNNDSNGNSFNNILEEIERQVADAKGLIMLDKENNVCAGNIFLVKGNSTPKEKSMSEGWKGKEIISGSGIIVLTPELARPDKDCLPTLAPIVIDLLETKLKLQVERRKIKATELYSADEVFTIDSMGEIVSVVEIDRREIGTGAMGEWTKRLIDEFHELVVAKGEAIWYAR